MPDVVQILVEFKSVVIAIKGQVILQEFNNQCVNVIDSEYDFFFFFSPLNSSLVRSVF